MVEIYDCVDPSQVLRFNRVLGIEGDKIRVALSIDEPWRARILDGPGKYHPNDPGKQRLEWVSLEDYLLRNRHISNKESCYRAIELSVQQRGGTQAELTYTHERLNAYFWNFNEFYTGWQIARSRGDSTFVHTGISQQLHDSLDCVPDEFTDAVDNARNKLADLSRYESSYLSYRAPRGIRALFREDQEEEELKSAVVDQRSKVMSEFTLLGRAYRKQLLEESMDKSATII